MNSSTKNPDELDEKCELCKGTKWLSFNVPVGHPKFGKIEPCECQKEKLSNDIYNKLQEISGIKSLKKLTFKNLKQNGLNQDYSSKFRHAHAVAQQYVHETNGWLIFQGPSGSGKTHLLVAILNQTMKKGNPAFYISTPDLLDHLRSSFGPNNMNDYDTLFDHIKNTPLLGLDDFGSESTTTWAKEKLAQLINYRYNRALPTVIALSTSLNQIDETIRGKLHDDNLVDIISLGSKQNISYGYLDKLRQDLTNTMTFDNFNYKNSKILQRGYEQAIEFASNPDGWLVIRGNTGSGKTHLAASITNQLETNETNCIFTFIPDLVDYLRLSINNTSPISHESLLKDLMTCEALILDDFGTKSNSTWIDEKIYQILVHRYESKFITVLTIRNLNEIPDSIISRLSDTALVDHIELDSPDYRQTKTLK
tara:strand:+ start:716 stop:1984 length:1269 start_codon:yes stop_codon:yes gene_type:complete